MSPKSGGRAWRSRGGGGQWCAGTGTGEERKDSGSVLGIVVCRFPASVNFDNGFVLMENVSFVGLVS